MSKKVTIEFNIEDNFDRQSLKAALYADSFVLALSDIQILLRVELKYKAHSEEVQTVLEQLRTNIAEIIEHRIGNLDDYIS